MTPEGFVIGQAINEGFKVLLQKGLTHIGMVCVKVKTFLGESMVPALIAIKREDIDTKPHERTYLFFGGQATNEEGGTASYVIFEAPPSDNILEVELPDESEVKWVSWNWKKKYEVEASRHNVSPHVVASENFDSDDKAKRWFRENIVPRPDLGMDWLTLIKVDQELVEIRIDRK
jgi:hypothetical protein